MNFFGSGTTKSHALLRAVFPGLIGSLTCLIILNLSSCAGGGRHVVSTEVIASDSTISVRSVGTPFQGALRMSISPDGVIHVADAGAGLVKRFHLAGSAGNDLGGSGSAPGDLFGPGDVEASSGIFVWVADTGNGRIQRFSARGALVEVLPVPMASEAMNETPRPIFRPENSGRIASSGRPVAIAVSENDDLYILEEVSGAVLWTDRQRSEWRVLGGATSGAGRLQRPVDLSYHNGRLFVADAGSASIHSFDSFGSHTGNLGQGLLEGISRIHASERGILAVLPNSLLYMDLEGQTIGHFTVQFSLDTEERGQSGEGGMVGAQWLGENLVILTTMRLFVSGW